MPRSEEWKHELRDARRREAWSLTGPLRIVKVTPRERPLPKQVHGYVCLEKSLLGKTPPEMETLLGLPSGMLAGGCRVFRLKRLPMGHEVDYELTARYPAGLAFNPAMYDLRYAPGSDAVHQWCLRADIPVAPLVSLGPAERYRYLHG